MKINKVVALLICIILSVVLYQFSLTMLFVGVTFLLLSGLSLFFTQKKKILTKNYIERRKILFYYFVECVLFVAFVFIVTIFSKFLSIKAPFYFVSGLFFVYISKDILFRCIGFRIMKFSYDYQGKLIYLRILVSNIFYFSIYWLSLLKLSYPNLKGNIIIEIFFDIMFILLLLDQAFLFFVNRHQSLINFILNIEIKEISTGVQE